MACRRRGRSRGIVLVEVMIATLLAAIITAGVFAAVLSSHQALARSDVSTQMTAAAKQLSDLLANYVRPTPPLSGPGDINPALYAPGGTGVPGTGCWDLVPTGNPCPNTWALADGTYANKGDFLLSPQLLTQYSAHLSYTVTTTGSGKSISISSTWTEQ